ncbi:MAG: TIR domain-containing protein [Longimicrobiaceae bacterium]
MNPQPATEEPQIFISYAREDRGHADAIASALRRHGWSVWWDPKIRLGTSYQTEIEAALDAALCVVVLWSTHAKASQWVKEEAQSGVDRAILIPVLIENVQPPLGFRSLQAAELSDWNGDENHREFQKLVEHIETLLGPGLSPERSPNVPRSVIDPPPPERSPDVPRSVIGPPPSERHSDTPLGVIDPLPSKSLQPAHQTSRPPSTATILVKAEERQGAPATLRIVALVGMVLYVLPALIVNAINILSMIIIGLTIAVIAKTILPGRDPGGIIVPILLGIAGSLVGGFLFGGSDARVGLIGSIMGALILLFLYRLIIGRRSAV